MHIVLLGDSIAQGLGVAGCSYADGIRARLRPTHPQTEVTNLAGTAAQITSSLMKLAEIVSWQPDVVIIAHGITEAIVRPVPSALRLIPRRWRQIGWLDPRPYFSRRPWKNLYHRAESGVRWRVKVGLIKRYGGCTLMPQEEFERALSGAVSTLLHATSTQVILLTHNGIDERFYPHSLSSLNRYQMGTQRVAADCQTGRVRVCDVSRLLDAWSDFFADHFHPNAAGHAKIAEAICEVIRADSGGVKILLANSETTSIRLEDCML